MNKRVPSLLINNKPSIIIIEETQNVVYIKPKKFSYYLIPSSGVENRHEPPIRTDCPVALWISILTFTFLLISSFSYFLAYFISVHNQNITSSFSCRSSSQKYKYTEECDKKRVCDKTKGLVCPSTTNTCNCPVLSSTIFCDCISGTYWDYNEDKCEALKKYKQDCIGNYQCNFKNDLTCQAKKCQCDENKHFWNGSNCVKFYSYNTGECLNDEQCEGNLICKIGNTCKCPENVSDGKCDCPTRSKNNEFFWNGTHCELARAYNVTCSVDYMCLTLTEGTICSESVCKCPRLKYYNYSNKKCEDKLLEDIPCFQQDACRNDLNLSCHSEKCSICMADWVLLRGLCLRQSIRPYPFSLLTPAMIANLCYNETEAVVAKFTNEDFDDFVRYFSTSDYIFFDAKQVGTSDIMESSDGSVTLVYQSPPWGGGILSTNPSRICATLKTDQYELDVCTHSHHFICQYEPYVI